MKVLYIGGTGEISYECVLRDVELGRNVTVFNRARRGESLPPQVAVRAMNATSVAMMI